MCIEKSYRISFFYIVEVAGIEPASKQGTQKLSTRLAVTSSSSLNPAVGRQIKGPVPKFRTTIGTFCRTISKLLIPHIDNH